MNQTETPEEWVARVSVGADQRRQRSLQAILAACEALRAKPGAELTVDAIGRLSHGNGGPAAQAIRNNTPSGLVYQGLIEQYRAYHGWNKASVKGSLIERAGLAHGVRDPGLRARIEHLLQENRHLKGEVLKLKHVAAQTAHVTLVPTAAGDAEIQQAVLGRALGCRLNGSQIAALRAAFDERRVRDAGWTIDERGRVFHGDREVLPIGFVGAIRAIVAMVDGTTAEASGGHRS